MNWPIGMGKGFKGIYDIFNNRIELYRSENEGESFLELDENGEIKGNHPLKQESIYRQVLEEIELVKGAGSEFDEEKIEKGELTPVFFGSALTNFGVKTFLDAYLQFAPAPAKHRTEEGNFVEPKDEEFSGFVFKIQANMNPNHRDRIAFVRICSGEFDRGWTLRFSEPEKD